MKRHGVKTAIIGIGRWGKNIARELYEMSDLVAYASLGDGENDAWAKEHIPHVRRMSTTEIAKDSSIEAVAIATPIPTHASLVEQFLGAGKHVFVEKPLAETVEEARRLATEAKSTKRVLAVGYVFLHHPVYQELKRRIGNTSITTLTMEWRKYGTFRESIEFNLLTHHLAIALDLLGMPESGTVRRGEGVESACDSLETSLVYPSVQVTSHIDRASKDTKHQIAVQLADGRSFIWDGTMLTEDGKIVFESAEPPLSREMHSFLDATENGVVLIGGEFGTQVLALHKLLKTN